VAQITRMCVTVAFLLISILGIIVFFKVGDAPVGGLFIGLPAMVQMSPGGHRLSPLGAGKDGDFLDPVVPRVGDVDVAGLVDGEAFGVVHERGDRRPAVARVLGHAVPGAGDGVHVPGGKS
jgi:hypothetical protein